MGSLLSLYWYRRPEQGRSEPVKSLSNDWSANLIYDFRSIFIGTLMVDAIAGIGFAGTTWLAVAGASGLMLPQAENKLIITVSPEIFIVRIIMGVRWRWAWI
jgi:hypothetical protein